MPNRRTFLALLIASPVVLSACGKKGDFTKLAKGSSVVALGDSLTFGYGAGQGEDYPSHLAKLTGWQIDNMGVNGDTTQNVLDRLDSVITKSPKLVLLGIGGNDVLRRVNPSETKSNLIKIIENLQAKNIPIILIAEPHFSVSALFGKASDNPIYKEVADELKIPLFEKGWSEILSDEKLKSDQIHANGEGYKKFAEKLYELLKEIGYA